MYVSSTYLHNSLILLQLYIHTYIYIELGVYAYYILTYIALRLGQYHCKKKNTEGVCCMLTIKQKVLKTKTKYR